MQRSYVPTSILYEIVVAAVTKRGNLRSAYAWRKRANETFDSFWLLCSGCGDRRSNCEPARHQALHQDQYDVRAPRARAGLRGDLLRLTRPDCQFEELLLKSELFLWVLGRSEYAATIT